jgi:hypothetical protein
MTINWQLLVVIAVIAGAGMYLVRSLWLWLRPKARACGGSCGCGEQTKVSTPDQLISVGSVRRRIPPTSQNGG